MPAERSADCGSATSKRASRLQAASATIPRLHRRALAVVLLVASRAPESMALWESMWARGLPPGAAFDASGPEPALVDLIVEGAPPLTGLAAPPDGNDEGRPTSRTRGGAKRVAQTMVNVVGCSRSARVG